LSLFISINSKWIKDLNIGPETLKLVQEKEWNTLKAISICKDFLIKTQGAQQLREKIDRWDYMNLNSFCTTKQMVSKLKRPFTEWEKIFASYKSDKRLINRIYKLNSCKINEPTRKWATELNRTFSKEEFQVAKKYIKKCSSSLTIKDANQNHTKIPSHSCQTNVGKDAWKKEPLYTAGGNVSYYNYYGKQYGDSLKN
jgi:hypothetical protein